MVAVQPPNRSPAAGTRCSAAPTWPSCRPPPPSPRTCPARSGSARHRAAAPAGQRRRGVPGPARGPAAARAPRRPGRPDAIVVCSFGDASVNHASATGRVQHRRLVRPHRAAQCRCCSSARTTGWASACARRRAGSRRRCAARPGHALLRRRRLRPGRGRTTAAAEAAAWVRRHRRPGRAAPAHGPADGPRRGRRRGRRTAAPAEIAADLARDPLVATARLLVEAGLLDRARSCWPATTRSAGRSAGSPRRCIGEPKLATAAEVVAPLAPRRPVRVARAVADAAGARHRAGRGPPARRRSAAGCRSRPAR